MRRHYLFNQICRIYGHHSISVLFTHTLIAQSIDIRQEAFIEERRFGAAKIRRKEYMISAHCRDLRSLGFRIDHIFKGSYCVGNPLEWLYDGKELIIGDALYWDFETETLKALLMKYGCGILTNLDYQETTIASGETMPAPCYSATLSFISSTGRRIPFNSKPSNDFELVNPAKVWIVNEHLLILRCTTEDAVYVDKDFSTTVGLPPQARR